MSKPVVANICLDFLKRDMLHIYRQITDLKTFRPVVLTRKRENASEFPFPLEDIALLRKPHTRALRRFWARTVRRRPVQIYRSEVDAILHHLEGFGAAVLHIYFGNVAVQLLPLIRACRIPVVVSFHGADAGVDDAGPAYRTLLRETLERSTLVIARSDALLEDLRAHGCPPKKLHLHRTGIPLDQWPARENSSPPTDGGWKLLQACRLIEKKGLETTLHAFAKILAQHPQATLTIAGDGPMKPALDQLATKLGIATSVQFTGFADQAELRRLVYTSHLFLHPSQTGADGNREGVPNAMLEAMATAMPVLATHHGGIPEAVTHRSSGLLSDEKDAATLAAHALDVIASPNLYTTLATGARQAVTENFERSKQTAALENIYRLAIDQTRHEGTVVPPHR